MTRVVPFRPPPGTAARLQRRLATETVDFAAHLSMTPLVVGIAVCCVPLCLAYLLALEAAEALAGSFRP